MRQAGPSPKAPEHSPSAHPAEVRLSGGNVSVVHRVGNTVRRPVRAWTETVHHVLRHVGQLSGVEIPQPLGVDERGREVLTYVPGVVPHDAPQWLWEEAVLEQVARSLRCWHDATAGCVPPEPVWGLPARQPAEVICHNDFAPYNLVFRDERIAGVIDFDACAPGPRLWDLAYTAYRFVPLMPPQKHPLAAGFSECSPFSMEELQRRLQLFLTHYAGGEEPLLYRASECVQTAALRLRALADWTEEQCAGAPNPELSRQIQMYRGHADWLCVSTASGLATAPEPEPRLRSARTQEDASKLVVEEAGSVPPGHEL